MYATSRARATPSLLGDVLRSSHHSVDLCLLLQSIKLDTIVVVSWRDWQVGGVVTERDDVEVYAWKFDKIKLTSGKLVNRNRTRETRHLYNNRHTTTNGSGSSEVLLRDSITTLDIRCTYLCTVTCSPGSTLLALIIFVYIVSVEEPSWPSANSK